MGFLNIYHVSYGDQVAMDLINISINGVEEMFIPKFIIIYRYLIFNFYQIFEGKKSLQEFHLVKYANCLSLVVPL